MYTFLLRILKSTFRAYYNAFSFIFRSDVDVISGKAKRILSDPDDRKVYLDAIDELAEDETKEATVKLKNKEEFTLIMD
ncbi:MAG: hypothetical protein EAS52_13320 [Parapedobacter sp.]|nr:MAG: hypothetical protein EAS52_13320 [Parapedobacter sp.]